MQRKFAVRVDEFPVRPAGNFTANPLWMLASSVRHSPAFAEIPSIFPVIREFDNGEQFAADCQHSHLVASFLALSRPSPNRTEKARKCATKWLWLCGRRVERRSLSATTCDFSRFSLQASFWGHTSRLCRWSSDRTTITARDNVNYHLDTSGAAEVTSPAAAETSQIDPSLSFQVGGLRER